MRPQQWVKNLFIFAALIFSGHLFISADLSRIVAGFALFSAAASGIYLFNDITDLERDRLHPLKKLRPLPSGRLGAGTAAVASAALGLAALAGAWALEPAFAAILLAYIVLNVLYSLRLKHVVILDVMTVAAGFVLRVLAGAVIISVPTSEWLIVCTVLLALFLGFSKRRHELTMLDATADTHRAVLQHYSPYFLDQMIGIVTASTVMSYILYTISDDTIAKFGTKNLIYTVPFVLYGIFRYLYLVHRRDEGGDPTRLALTDRPLLFNTILWIVSASAIIYHWG
jgi:4-hydroxybenzoate polyprenyltransferase